MTLLSVCIRCDFFLIDNTSISKDLLFKVMTFKSGKEFLTLAITVCLKDGAILIADSLQTTPFSNLNSSINVVKIKQITETVGCIEFGIAIATQEALRQLDRTIIINSSSPFEILSEIRRALLVGWKLLLNSIPQDVDTTDKYFKAGLLVAGFIPKSDSGGFIGGDLFPIKGNEKPTIDTSPNHRIILGGEENDSTSIFDQFAIAGLQHKSSILGTINNLGIRNNTINAYLQAGVRTIRKIEKVNSRIGGPIQYLILRRGFKPLGGMLLSP